MGDPAGIGLEITIKAWALRRQREVPEFVLVADPDCVTDRGRALGLGVETAIVDDPAAAAAWFATALPILPVKLDEPSLAGQPSAANARAVIAAIEVATRCVMEGRAAALVTNPIAKSVLYGAGFTHPGHTEFLADLSAPGGTAQPIHPVMMLASAELRVVPLTIHVPLAAVPRLVTAELIVRTVEIVAAALRHDFGVPEPRIAVAGLNPHAGEAGALGGEEIAVIAPALADLVARGYRVTGPHSADTLFHAAARETYDVAIAMYHDQALIPIKTLAFDSGVNVTLGLPFVRTSPDHGTAFDIAAKGVASPQSLIAALQLAGRMTAARAAHAAGARPA